MGSALIHSVDHAFRLIAHLAAVSEPQGVSDLARALDLPRPTIYRLLDTLRAHHIVAQDRAGRRVIYRLGLRLLELGGTALCAANLQALCTPHLTELVERTGETAHFAVLDGDQVGYVAKVDGGHAIRMFSHVGWRGPLHATAAGKALLAWSDGGLMAAITASKLPRFSGRTITEPRALVREIASVRRKGYAVDREELIDGLLCIAAPVLKQARLVGAVSISGPASRLKGDSTLVAAVCETARCIGAAS
jgi:IclR family acetate operon transcriptional repressor